MAKFYSVAPADIIVVHDELDIDFGRIRLKFGGGVAGHNGLRSVGSALGTNDFQRVRIGIGRPPGRMEGAAFVRMHGQDIPVRARVERLDSLSAHADSDEILQWLGQFPRPPALTCLVHGEPGPMDALKARIETELRWTVATPEPGERVEIR